MRKLFQTGALVALVCFVFMESVQAELTYIEEMTATAQHRLTHTLGPQPTVVFDTALPGRAEFGSPGTHLVFAHRFIPFGHNSLEAADIRSISLTISLRNGAGEEIELAIDSINGRKFVRRIFTIGPGENDFVTLVESPLADGELYIVLNSPEGVFTVDRSFLTVRFAGTVPIQTSEYGSDAAPEIELRGNYPNPFNPSTVIEYRLPRSMAVRVEIINAMGQIVRTLVNEIEEAGLHRLEWDGRADDGTAMSTGVYIYRVATEQFTDSRKMMLVK